MQTQISCPNCGTTYPADVHQVIDVGRNPELKQMLLAGQLNVATCPNCGASGQMATAMLYHDPGHDLFMVYVPQELNLDQVQREQYVGQLARQVMESTPQEQRRAYMFQPQQVLSMQMFMENVLETEGVTKEMIARQQKQAELLNTLARADSDVQDYLIKERMSEIDETFFAMLRSYVEQAEQMDDNAQFLPLVNLQAKLMTTTSIGQELERRQIAMHALSRDAKQADGLTPEILLFHVLQNQEDAQIVNMLARSGAPAMTYAFFSGLTAEIESQDAAGNREAALRLSGLRDNLLQLQSDMQKESEEVLQAARRTLEHLVAAEDVETAVNQNIDKVDDAFMYLLQAEINHAQQSGKLDYLQSLERIYELIVHQAEQQVPPEIQLINDLVQAEANGEINRLLDENQTLVSEDLLKVVDMLQEQLQASGQQPAIVERLGMLKPMIRERI